MLFNAHEMNFPHNYKVLSQRNKSLRSNSGWGDGRVKNIAVQIWGPDFDSLHLLEKLGMVVWPKILALGSWRQEHPLAGQPFCPIIDL